jgi:insulysin
VDAEAVALLTKKDMVNFFAHFISPSSPHRAKLSVHLIAKETSRKPKEQGRMAAFVPEHESPLSSRTTCIDEGSEDLDAQVASSIHDARIAGGAPPFCGLEDGPVGNDMEIQKKLGVGMTVVSQPFTIKDCHAWRMSIPVSAGVKPVKPMEEFAKAPLS